MKKSTVAILLILLVLIVVVPIAIHGKTSEFGGADGQAEEAITEIDPDYEPWFSPVIEHFFEDGLPGELESMLFCIQAAIGSGIVCFGLGYMISRYKYKNNGVNAKE